MEHEHLRRTATHHVGQHGERTDPAELDGLAKAINLHRAGATMHEDSSRRGPRRRGWEEGLPGEEGFPRLPLCWLTGRRGEQCGSACLVIERMDLDAIPLRRPAGWRGPQRGPSQADGIRFERHRIQLQHALWPLKDCLWELELTGQWRNVPAYGIHREGIATRHRNRGKLVGIGQRPQEGVRPAGWLGGNLEGGL